jgi:S-DNA-T family DNA segregation ATPase FtsK/SpoIIIE
VEIERTAQTRVEMSEPNPVATLHIHAGPDAGRMVSLTPGRLVLGRGGAADVRIADPALSIHHALLSVEVDGSVRYDVLNGPGPTCFDDHGNAVDRARTDLLDLDVHFRFGNTLVSVTRSNRPGEPDPAVLVPGEPDSAVPYPTVPDPAVRDSGAEQRWGPIDFAGRVPLEPRSRQQLEDPPTPPVAPGEPVLETFPPLTGLAPAVIAVVGAVVLSFVFHQPTMLAFGLVGATMAIASVGTPMVTVARARRRTLASYARQQELFSLELEDHVRSCRRLRWEHDDTLSRAVWSALTQPAAVWDVRSRASEGFSVSVGVGDVAWDAAVIGEHAPLSASWAAVAAHERLRAVPVRVPVGPDQVVSVRGGRQWGLALVRSIVTQLCVEHAPGRLHVRFITGPVAGHPGDDSWSWASWMPHRNDSDEPVLDGVHTVFVVDDTSYRPQVSSRRDGLHDDGIESHERINRAYRPHSCHFGSAMAIIELGPSGSPEHPDSTCVIRQRSDGLATVDFRVLADSGWGSTHTMLMSGLDVTAAEDVAASLAGFTDATAPTSAPLPNEVSLGELLDVEQMLAGWNHRGAEAPVVATIGMSLNGPATIDLDRDGPHLLVAGTTGSGKSELLRTFVVSLCLQAPPSEVSFVLIDYKGGSAFDACDALPHVVGVVTDLDDHESDRVLSSLDAELRHRERLLRAASVSDLRAYRCQHGSPRLPRLVIVVDEFATLASELPGFVSALVGIAQRGRSVGLHLVLATQRPAGVITDAIRTNTNARIALRVPDRVDSLDVIGDPVAAELPRHRRGRAVARFGHGDLVAFQTASTSLLPATVTATTPVAACATSSAAAVIVRPRRSPHIATEPVSDSDPGVAPPAFTWLSGVVNRVREHAMAIGEQGVDPPWCPPLPCVLDADVLDPGAVGLLDDPACQVQHRLAWDPATGHLAVVGSVGSGTSTTLLRVAESLTREHGPAALHLYALVAHGASPVNSIGDWPHTGAVVAVGDGERLERLTRILGREVDRRSRYGDGDSVPRTQVVVLMDGIAAARVALEAIDPIGLVAMFDDVLSRGPAVGIAVAAAEERAASLPPGFAERCAQRWVLRLAEAGDAAVLGLGGSALISGPPGRGVRVGDRLKFQIASPTGRLPDGIRPAFGAALEVGVLPELVLLDELDSPEDPDHLGADDSSLVVGIEGEWLATCRLRLRKGEHLLVAGAPRSGRSTTLDLFASQWSSLTGDRWVGSVRTSTRGGAACVERLRAISGELDDVLDAFETWRIEHSGGAGLLLVDDAEMVSDPSGRLERIVAASSRALSIVAACRPDTARQCYGHWLAGVRRSGTGLLLGRVGDLDRDALGVMLPRRAPAPMSPGRGWLVSAHDRPVFVQVATVEPLRQVGTLNDPPHDSAMGRATRSVRVEPARAAR